MESLSIQEFGPATSHGRRFDAPTLTQTHIGRSRRRRWFGSTVCTIALQQGRQSLAPCNSLQKNIVISYEFFSLYNALSQYDCEYDAAGAHVWAVSVCESTRGFLTFCFYFFAPFTCHFCSVCVVRNFDFMCWNVWAFFFLRSARAVSRAPCLEHCVSVRRLVSFSISTQIAKNTSSQCLKRMCARARDGRRFVWLQSILYSNTRAKFVSIVLCFRSSIFFFRFYYRR